jgi:hypothetical protein
MSNRNSCSASDFVLCSAVEIVPCRGAECDRLMPTPQMRRQGDVLACSRPRALSAVVESEDLTFDRYRLLHNRCAAPDNLEGGKGPRRSARCERALTSQCLKPGNAQMAENASRHLYSRKRSCLEIGRRQARRHPSQSDLHQARAAGRQGAGRVVDVNHRVARQSIDKGDGIRGDRAPARQRTLDV